MKVELLLTGADAIRNAFRALSSDLDNLNRKLDSTQARLNTMGAGSGVSSSSGSPSSSPAVAIPPASPPVVGKPPSGGGTTFKGVAIGSSVGTQGRNIANSALGMFAPEVKIAVEALAALAAVTYIAAHAIREYADLQFVSRGGPGAGSQLAGVSKAVGVDYGEAGGLAESRPGGAKQLNMEIDILRNIKDEQAAAVYARNRGIEGYRSVRNITDEQYQLAKNQNGIPEGAQVAADQSFASVSIAFTELTNDIRVALVPALLVVATTTTALIRVIDTIIAPLTLLGTAISTFFEHGDKAADKISNAADKFQDSVNKIQDGAFGGGARTRGAIPAAWQWAQKNGATANQVQNLGGIL